MTMRDMDDLINERIVWVDDELRAMLPAAKDEPIVYGMLRYHLGWTDPAGVRVGPEEARRYGGMRLRGALAILAAEAGGGKVQAIVRVGGGVGMILNFSRIDDAIADEHPQ